METVANMPFKNQILLVWNNIQERQKGESNAVVPQFDTDGTQQTAKAV